MSELDQTAMPPLSPPPVSEPVPTVDDQDEEPGEGDPFEGWPASESAAVIEEAPADGASVEHVRGEVEVPDAITVMPVPGAFELPLAAMALAKTRRYACIVALGAIVRGDTPHFEYVASECASGLQLAGIETGVPVAFGVLTVENVEQAEARIDKAAEAVRSALEMADLFARLRASARS